MSEAVKDADTIASSTSVLVNGLEDAAIIGVIGLAGFVVWETRGFIKTAYNGVAEVGSLFEDQLGMEDDPCRVSADARHNWWYGLINPWGSAVSAIRCKTGMTYYLEKDEDERLLLDLQKPHWERIEKDALVIAAGSLIAYAARKKIGTLGLVAGIAGTVLLVNDMKNQYQQIGNYDLSKDDIEIARGEEITALEDLKAYLIEDVKKADKAKFAEDAALIASYLSDYRKINRADVQSWLYDNPYIARVSQLKMTTNSGKETEIPEMLWDFLNTLTLQWQGGWFKLPNEDAQAWYKDIYNSMKSP